MPTSPFIFEADAANFSDLLQRSREVPVLVDFWASWCAPCQMLMPVLAKLAEEYQGKFLLVKVNTDEQPEIAQAFGVRSLPTLMLFKDGQPVDSLLGAQPESTLRQMLDRYIEKPSDRLREEARKARERGALAEARKLIEEALALAPNAIELKLDLARILFEEGDYAAMDALLRSLPPSPEVKALQGMLAFARIAEQAPPRQKLEAEVRAHPENSEARYQLGARMALEGDFEGALENFLELLKRDPAYRDRAKEAMLAIFERLSGQGELVNRYRMRMFTALH